MFSSNLFESLSDMDDQLNDNESLIAHIQQVEHERDELRKDIEQLCMQQAGPGYLAVATRMHFQRTAGLEQEIESLKKKLTACTREKLNLQEELSEAYRIKGQLADLHAAEVSKAEKSKEKEELMSQKLNNLQKRVEELDTNFFEEKKLTAALQIDLEEQNKQNETFKKVINKFYEIRQYSINGFCEDRSWEDKCECLLHDSPEMWDFNDQGETSTSKYINGLEEQVEKLRKSVDNLQNKLSVGLEIENHLKKRVRDLEKKKSFSEEMIKRGISGLHHYHSEHKAYIMNLLDEGYSDLKSIIEVVEEKIRQLDASREQSWKSPLRDVMLDENDCRDLHVNTIADPNLFNKWNVPRLPNSMAIASGDASKALAQALQEKVAALLLLSQQEERHLLERNVSAALQKKVEELQRNLLQVTNEKVKALMELAQLKREYQLLQEKINNEMKQGKLLADIGEKRIVPDSNGRLKNMLKRTYLKRWIGTVDSPGYGDEAHLKGNVSDRRSNYSMDIARMKIENATLKESLESMEHLTSAVRRLRLSLLKVKESVASEGTVTGPLEALDDIITEAKLVKTALGISLPVSWSAEANIISSGKSFDEETNNVGRDSNGDIDFVSAAGYETVEILILAAQILKDDITTRGSRDGS
ncbi:spindle pole body component 110 isoform X1 [Camellia sinensis]|uniref:spindle pole body component 110 isoform X1 n=2 Tax=Camellia sinensis TaxID=4442 RepID=UPI00103551D2|nr:spindle pole body component 110 isoform X1 [Camellia sinensis]